jgi:hypothetical protein
MCGFVPSDKREAAGNYLRGAQKFGPWAVKRRGTAQTFCNHPGTTMQTIQHEEVGKSNQSTSSIRKGASIMTKFYIQYMRNNSW